MIISETLQTGPDQPPDTTRFLKQAPQHSEQSHANLSGFNCQQRAKALHTPASISEMPSSLSRPNIRHRTYPLSPAIENLLSWSAILTTCACVTPALSLVYYKFHGLNGTQCSSTLRPIAPHALPPRRGQAAHSIISDQPCT